MNDEECFEPAVLVLSREFTDEAQELAALVERVVQANGRAGRGPNRAGYMHDLRGKANAMNARADFR